MSYSIDITDNPNFWFNFRDDFLQSTKYASLVDGLMLHLYKNYKAKLTTITEGSKSTMVTRRYAIVFETEADATMFMLRWS